MSDYDPTQVLVDPTIPQPLPSSVMSPGFQYRNIAIALSGGGSRGDFEVGALRYIYDRFLPSTQDMLFGTNAVAPPALPALVCGTSVGSVNAGMLGTGLGGLERLEQVWSELRTDTDMHVEHSAFTALGARFDGLKHALEDRAIGLGVVTMVVPVFGPHTVGLGALAAASSIEEASRLIPELRSVPAVRELRPIKERIRQNEVNWSPLGPGVRGASVAIAATQDGHIVVMARGVDDHLYVKASLAPAGTPRTWSREWVRLGGPVASDPVFLTSGGALRAVAAVFSADRHVHVLGLGAGDPHLRATWDRDWQDLGVPTPVAVSDWTVGGSETRFDGNLAATEHPTSGWCFALRSDNGFPFAGFEHGSGPRFGYALVGNNVGPFHEGNFYPFAGCRIAIAVAGLDMVLFARLADGRVVTAAGGRDWRPLDGGLASSDVTVVSRQDGRIEVLLRGADGQVWHNTRLPPPGDAFAGWQSLGGVVSSNIAAAVDAGQRLHVAARGLDDHVWFRIEAPGGGWGPGASGWERIESPPRVAGFATDPVILRTASGALELVAVGRDRAVYTTRKDGSGGWSQWESLGGCTWTGIDLRFAAVCLEDGELRHVDQAGRVGGTPEPPVRMSDAIIASSAIPLYFPAINLNDRTYVDGGVRSAIPISAAIAAGADEVVAVAAASRRLDPPSDPIPTEILKEACDLGVLGALQRECSLLDILFAELTATPDHDFRRAGFLQVAERVALELFPAGILDAELHPVIPYDVSVRVIQPTFNVHDALTIDPGLIRICQAYGYMRAGDVLHANEDPAALQSSDAIISVRAACWALERLAAEASSMAGQPGWPMRLPRANHAVRVLRLNRKFKEQLKILLDQRIAAGFDMPPGHALWSERWEVDRPGLTAGGSPWGALTIPTDMGPVVLPAA